MELKEFFHLHLSNFLVLLKPGGGFGRARKTKRKVRDWGGKVGFEGRRRGAGWRVFSFFWDFFSVEVWYYFTKGQR